MKTLFALIVPAVLLALPALAPAPAPAPSPMLHPAPASAPLSEEPAMSAAQKITTFLWFDDDAEEAIRFYTSVFPDSKVLSESRWGPGGPVPADTLMGARFRLAGQEFMALNGGPMHRFNEAISLFVSCATQAEIDELWSKLTADGGEPGQCGWLKDRWGLSWQVVPDALCGMMGDRDPARAARVGQAMMGMGRLDIAALQAAYDGR